MLPEEKSLLKELLAINEVFLKQHPGRIDYQQVSDGLLSLSGARFVLINLFNEDCKTGKTAALSGVPEAVKKATGIMGHPIRGAEWNVHPGLTAERAGQGLVKYKGISEVSGGFIAKPTAFLLEKTLSLGDIYGLALADPEGRVIGDLVFIMAAGEDISNREAIELYGGQFGMHLMRLQAEEALQESERKYRLVAENTIDVIWVVNPDMTLRYVNPSIFQLTGYTPEQCVGKHLRDFHDRDDYTYMKNIMKEMRAGRINQPVTFDVELIQKSGRKIPVEVRGRLFFDEQGRLTSMQGTTRDISKRKQAEEALLAEQKEKLTILDNIVEQVVFLDPEYRIVWANSAVSKVKGMEMEEFIGMKCYQVWHNREEPCAGCPLVKVLETGRIHSGENVSPDGRTWRSTGSPVYNDQGKLTGMLSTALDISDVKQAESELKEINTSLELKVKERTAELERMVTELKAFTYSASHDLKAPLRTIDGFSRILLEDYADAVDEEARSYLERICAASARMGELIDDLLKLSRVTSQELCRTDVDLSSLTEQYVRELQEKEPCRRVDVAITPLLCASGDLSLLRIALENLLDNAWKFTSSTEQPRIEFGAQQRNGRRVYFISDNGAGFDMKYSEQIFNAFQRLHSPQEYPGTGVGLSIVSRIIERHGGDIWASGEPGKGATFYFTLPG